MIIALLAAILAVAMIAQTAGGMPAPGPAPRTEYVISPWTGIFFAGEYPGATPYVTVGTRVEPGTIVGRIETAMVGGQSIMVPAGVQGTVIEVLVRDEQMVGVGYPLFKVAVRAP